jgi:histidinol-phosphate aminotransferase
MNPAWIRANVRALSGYVPGEQTSDPEIIKLNTNENPYPPPEGVMRALRNIPADALRKYPDPLCAQLRERLAALHGVEPDRILCGNGSDEILTLCMRAFVESAGAVACFEPSYSLYPVLADIAGVPCRAVPLGDGFAWPGEVRVEASLFFLAHPNAPTGRVYDEEAVLGFCRSFDGVVVIDEAYADFAERTFVAAAAGMDNVLIARTFSKSFSLAGARFGYAVGPAPLIDALRRIKDSYNVNAVTQALALAALDCLEETRAHTQRVIRIREQTAGALAGAFEVAPSAANFLWVRPRAGTAEAWFRALRDEKILVRHFPGPRTGAWLRITVGTEKQMETLCDAVERIMPKCGEFTPGKGR